jgi:GR25 family glycosyltransferase involved in LPS biosynthesis
MKKVYYGITSTILLVAIIYLILHMWRNGEGFENAKIPIFIISLDRRPERRKLMLDRIQEDPRYYIADVTAVDGKTHLTEKFINGHGQIGCFLSHIGVWGRLSQMEDDVQWGLVLEDDANIDFPKDWDRVVNLAVNHAPTDWELLWIGALKIVSPEKNVKINNHLYFNNSIIWGTHAYLIKKTAAQKLYSKMRHYESIHKLIEFESLDPVDIYLSHNVDVPLYQYILAHDLIGQQSMGSDTNIHYVENKSLQ